MLRIFICLAALSCLAACETSSCFVAGTPIATPSGNVAIETLRVGDEVLAYDSASGAVVPSRVTHTMAHALRDFDWIALADGTVLGVTDEHPIYDPASDAYVEAGDLDGSSRVLALGGNRADPATRALSLSALHRSAGGRATVYNITVERHHNYFAAGMLVHNKEPFYSCDGTLIDGMCIDAAIDDGGDASDDAPN